MLDYSEILKNYHIELLKMKDRIQEINLLQDKMYVDKLKGIIQEDDFIRFSLTLTKRKVKLRIK